MATGRKKGAPVGNQNAKGTGGARTAIAGSLIPFGTFAGGALLGATNRNQRALSRHTKVATGLGAIGGGITGAIAGTAVMPIVGTAVGGAVGIPVGAASSYMGSKIGQVIGRKLK